MPSTEGDSARATKAIRNTREYIALDNRFRERERRPRFLHFLTSYRNHDISNRWPLSLFSLFFPSPLAITLCIFGARTFPAHKNILLFVHILFFFFLYLVSRPANLLLIFVSLSFACLLFNLDLQLLLVRLWKTGVCSRRGGLTWIIISRANLNLKFSIAVKNKILFELKFSDI